MHPGVVFALLAMVLWGFEELFLKEAIVKLRKYYYNIDKHRRQGPFERGRGVVGAF